jgi:hypothetical protein
MMILTTKWSPSTTLIDKAPYRGGFNEQIKQLALEETDI